MWQLPPVSEMKSDIFTRLVGTVKRKCDEEPYFQFDCGFTVPLKQIQFLIPNRTLKVGDKVSIKIEEIRVKPHEHEFKCSCGAEQ